MRHSWTCKALERVRHSCKLFATQLEENREEEEPIVSMMRLARTTLAGKRIIDIVARCMTKIDKRKEVQSLRTKLKAHDLDLDSLDSRIAKRAVAALSLKWPHVHNESSRAPTNARSVDFRPQWRGASALMMLLMCLSCDAKTCIYLLERFKTVQAHKT